MSEPIVYARQWRPVMQAAGYRCQCTGQCGKPHTKTDRRCPREHDQQESRGPVYLVAAPTDLRVSAVAASRLTSWQLSAWCPGCHDAARKKATVAAADQDELFTL